MSATTIFVYVKNDANTALICAYKTLLSFNQSTDTYVNENGLLAHAKIRTVLQTTSLGEKLKLTTEWISCIISIFPLEDSTCKMCITAELIRFPSGYFHTGESNQFIAEFLKRFYELLEQGE